MLLHEVAAEVLLCGKRVVGSTVQREIVRRVLAAVCKRLDVVQFQATSFGAAQPRSVRIRATRPVAFIDGAPDSSGNVAGALSSPAPARLFGVLVLVLGDARRIHDRAAPGRPERAARLGWGLVVRALRRQRALRSAFDRTSGRSGGWLVSFSRRRG